MMHGSFSSIAMRNMIYFITHKSLNALEKVKSRKLIGGKFSDVLKYCRLPSKKCVDYVENYYCQVNGSKYWISSVTVYFSPSSRVTNLFQKMDINISLGITMLLSARVTYMSDNV
ncbi:hypothetical protein WA026_022399 [Henosepilachna vigintioctopunctata]|uniref:Uncharacterized protein n=1 Tax=Henosepilachna vigintioctopunctata TaxID=420089 RepID=A0AAW1UBL2_9CUCU